MMAKFYVKPETAKGKVIAYGVYDCVGGMESEHAIFKVGPDVPAETALQLANAHRNSLDATTTDRSL